MVLGVFQILGHSMSVGTTYNLSGPTNFLVRSVSITLSRVSKNKLTGPHPGTEI